MKQYVQQTIKLGTASVLGVVVAIQMGGEFKHEVRQFEKSYDN
ncbi:hypothetical protein, partial [Acinetobacter baumannii]